MNRAVSSYSDVSSIDEETLLQQELSRLQRQYRIMENERKQKCLNARLTMETQQDALKQLDSEMQDIQVVMRRASSKKNRDQDRENFGDLRQYMDGQDEYSRLITSEVEEIQSIDRQISEIEEKINAQHRNMGGVHASHQRHVTTQHTIRVFENRLNKTTREFNDCLAQNAKLREQIQHLRSQRAVFDSIHKRLYKDLTSKKREQMELIEQTTMAFDQRDEAEQKMSALKDRNQKDLAQYNMEYKELMRQLDHDETLKKFLLDKAQERWELAEAVSNERKKSFELKAERQAEKVLKEYLNAFKDIRKITGETQNTKLVERFIEMEDQNFTMYNYMNEISNQLECENDKIRMLENQTLIYKADSEQVLDEKKSERNILQDRLKQQSVTCSKLNESLKRQGDLLFNLKMGVKKIFSNCGCSTATIDNKLGNQNDVNDQNIMEYLATIEEMANDMLRRHVIVNSSDQDCLAMATVHKVSDSPGPAPLADETPVAHPEESKSSDSVVHDITNIRKQAVKQMQIREKERALAAAEKPQVHISGTKNRKHKK